MSISDQTILKTIYELGGGDHQIKNQALSYRFNISASSTYERLQELAQQQLVTYEKYRGVMITKRGIHQILSTVQQQRLMEIWLATTFDLDEVTMYELATKLSVAPDSRLIAQLKQLLANPETCPHGNPIPDKSLKSDVQGPEVALSDVTVGKQGTLMRIQDDVAPIQLLENLKIPLGTTLSVQGRDEQNKTLLVNLNAGEPSVKKVLIPLRIAQQLFIKATRTKLFKKVGD